MNPAATPTPKPDTQDGRWMNVHNRYVSEAKEKEPEVIMIGDSLIQHLEHLDYWNRVYAPMHTLNFGIGGDETQHVLWRISNGELDNVKPKVVVILAGTNNSGSSEEIAEGILEIVKVVRDKQPDAYIVLLSLLPRGHLPNPLRDRNEAINVIIKEKALAMNKVEVLSIGQCLVQPDGTISHHDMYDYLHLTNAGYEKAFEPLAELLQQLLSEGEVEHDLTPSE
ncbi:platelet-activating factor acetylhydrolase IB subunit beta homolog [Thrips palmi]|uniref:Platelet-activating factor acetylhydrolase IB subunit beta homolog n=1 Tax=Thrips palmi TaxID=161013 RepID=A0A6P8Z9M3_THRPL|nr:platelet-activating factor acetylhydrolase IB subunit beta homolog [Thrips palmi]